MTDGAHPFSVVNRLGRSGNWCRPACWLPGASGVLLDGEPADAWNSEKNLDRPEAASQRASSRPGTPLTAGKFLGLVPFAHQRVWVKSGIPWTTPSCR